MRVKLIFTTNRDLFDSNLYYMKKVIGWRLHTHKIDALNDMEVIVAPHVKVKDRNKDMVAVIMFKALYFVVSTDWNYDVPEH